MSDFNKFYVKIANLTVEMNARFEFAENHCRDYIADHSDRPDIVSRTTQNEIDAEKKQFDIPLSDGYCEDICLYRSIAEQLPDFDRVVFHGAAVEAGGRGYIFTAPSGTGKTTHISLWLEHFPEKVKIINGDKPILKLDGDGATVYSTPWAGKEGMQRNAGAPVGAICLIRRAKENKITKISPGECFSELVKQFYLPKNVAARIKTLDIIDRVLKGVPIYLLECNISREAAELSFNTLTNE